MTGAAATKIGHGLARVFDIKLQYRENPEAQEKVTRGESTFSVGTADTYVEHEPSSLDWLRDGTPGPASIKHYIVSLFPFIHWIGKYNLQWFIGDLVAGVTIGAVVVPQGMAYAKLAQLPVQFGLYSAFFGVLLYWIFGTSKDITIGPVAVMSQVTGTIVLEVAKKLPHYQGYQVASAVAIIAGGIVCALGLLRLGWVVDFISLTSITAFITGAALNILVGQVPTLLGISSTYVNTRAATYLVMINTLKNLRHCTLDAAIGLTSLVMLYIIRYVLTLLAKRFPSRAKLFFFLSTLRTVFVILLYTAISYGVNHKVAHATKGVTNTKGTDYKKAHFAILGPVPRGFTAAGVPVINREIVGGFANNIPVAVIVLLIEHIAISKSFGRINNYTINPSQELLSIGVTNLLAPFLGGYPATGSFSRTAIKAKAGVRTPLAGVITAVVVLLAIYALPAMFYWISNANLAAVIIHAVGDLIADPNTVYQFWRISPLEVIIFFIGVFVTIFVTIEWGIYTTMIVSVVLLLIRVAKARGRFLGKVKVHSVVGDHLVDAPSAGKGGFELRQRQLNRNSSNDDDTNERTVFLPIDHQDGSNPEIELSAPYPGVFIYRFSEGFNYPNASHYLDHMVETIFRETRRTNTVQYARLGDRPWNDPGKTRSQTEEVDYSKPTLKAVILDFSSVNNVDVTVAQQLIDVRNQLDRYASPGVVEWHFACINNRWTKRALVSVGFGGPVAESKDGAYRRWKPLFSVAEIGGADSAAAAAEAEFNHQRQRSMAHGDIEGGNGYRDEAGSSSSGSDNLNGGNTDLQKERTRAAKRVAVVGGLNRPFFHLDITNALNAAIAGIEANGGVEEGHEKLDYTGAGPNDSGSGMDGQREFGDEEIKEMDMRPGDVRG